MAGVGLTGKGVPWHNHNVLKLQRINNLFGGQGNSKRR